MRDPEFAVLVERFGDIVHEMPEIADALEKRREEIRRKAAVEARKKALANLTETMAGYVPEGLDWEGNPIKKPDGE